MKARYHVAVVLALGLAAAVFLFTLAAVVDSLNKQTDLSDNSTQVLLAAIGGMVGALGAFLAGRDLDKPDEQPDPEDKP